MGFGPFYTEEEKAEINAALHKNYRSKVGEVHIPDNYYGGDIVYDMATGQPRYKNKDGKTFTMDGPYSVVGERGIPYQTVAPGAKLKPQLSEERPDKGSNYIVAGVEYDSTTHRPVGAPAGGYSLGNDGKMTAYPKASPAPSTVPVRDLRSDPMPDPPTVAPPEPPGEPPLEQKPDDPAPTPLVRTPDTRVNANGIQQSGITLGGINKIFEGTGYSFADSNELYKTEGTEQQMAMNPQLFDTDMEMTKPGLTDKYRSTALPITDAQTEQLAMDPSLWTKDHGMGNPAKVTRNHELTHSLFQEAPSAAGTTGRNQEDPTEGVARSGDLSDRSRAIHFDHDTEDERFSNFGLDHPDDSKLVSPMYKNANRNTFRNAFLDDSVSSARAIRNAYATQGVYSGPEGTYQRQGDDIVKVDPSKAYAFKNEVANGRNPADKFKDGYVAGVKASISEDDETETPKPTKAFDTTIS